MTPNLVHESVNTCLECERNYKKFVCGGLISSSVWKSDSVKRLASFENPSSFDVPKEQAALCFGCFFNSFNLRGWVANCLKTVRIEE